MGGKWFNDSVTTTEGKEGMEQLRRSWIIELGELSSIKRSDVESVKAYLSKRVDIYRAAYDRRAAEHPRQCIFCGTTNETHFLKGDTGNRRFWVIAIDPSLRKYKDWKAAIMRDRNQLWAEAVAIWKAGEKLYLEDEAMEAQARQMQVEFNDDSDDPIVNMLTTYLDRKLPADWGLKNVCQRREWLRDTGGDPTMAAGTEVRTRVCAAEFICEVLGKEMTDKEYKYLARRISKLIRQHPEWEPAGASRHADKIYGVQKAFKRVTASEDEDEL